MRANEETRSRGGQERLAGHLVTTTVRSTHLLREAERDRSLCSSPRLKLPIDKSCCGSLRGVITCWWSVGWNRCATLVFAHSPSPPAEHRHPGSIEIVLGVFCSLGPPPIPPPPDVAGRIVFLKCSFWCVVQLVPCAHLERISALAISCL